MDWNEKLKFARKVSGFTLRQVESKTGVSNAYLSQLETGKIKDPGFFTMIKLLDLYNLEPSDMVR
jgi:transcriptional regulator with XRE-family HTH domain